MLITPFYSLRALLFLFLTAFLSTPVETDVAGLMALLILNTFQAMHAQCPAVANASSAPSPAFSPNLLLKISMKLAEEK